MPLIAHTLLENLQLLNNAAKIFNKKCVAGITANPEVCKKNVNNSTAIITALVPKIGYNNASKIAEIAQKEKISIKNAALKSGLFSNEDFEYLITPEAVCRLGN
jgi:fumarate hydratase class II